MIADWKCAAMVPTLNDSERKIVEEEIVVHSIEGAYITFSEGSKNGKTKLLNFSSFDFLGLSNSEELKEASRAALNRYGCGSCGPRGFYGTLDAHLELEDKFAALCGTESAIMYSDGASTASSTVAAFAKRGDLLVIDEGIYEALLTGVTLSRSNIKVFKHNDMSDLARVLDSIEKEDKVLKRGGDQQRRFIVVEALYRNFGDICPLDEVVKLKNKHFFRLIVDESLSFGTLGSRGLGLQDHFNLHDTNKGTNTDIVEITTVSLENAIGSVGGMTIGNLEVVDHQRLSGAGYCFSASAPPFVASAACAALKIIGEGGGKKNSAVKLLQQNVKQMVSGLKKIKNVVVTSNELSPLLFVTVKNRESKEDLDKLTKEFRKEGVLVINTGAHVSHHLRIVPKPMLRLSINALHTRENIDRVLEVFSQLV